jgi:hypothetical protein
MIAMVCILSVFFVPLTHGPYSAVHGPMTALRSLRNRLQLALAMWLAALGFVAATLLARASSASVFWARQLLPGVLPPELSAVLRC